MAKTLKILGVHGLGDHRDLSWQKKWDEALREVIPLQDNLTVETCFANYDFIFEQTDISFLETTKALWKLGTSGISTTFGRRRGLIGDISDKIRWTAGYVVAWVEDDEFQTRTRNYLIDLILQEKPNVIIAHSLGSLITYNLLTHAAAQNSELAEILKKVIFISCGSQIGNPFVIRNLTPGRIECPDIKHWYHFFNREDAVFTAPIKLHGVANFRQLNTDFDIGGFADHDAAEYIKHKEAEELVWTPIASNLLLDRPATTTGERLLRGSKVAKSKYLRSKKQRRALLIGINEYPNDSDKLAGCVNDVFLMSSILQESGFAPEEIRICLDDRATKAGIMSRLEWLMDDPAPGDERVFYYSGHGAQIPEYGLNNEPDRMSETLVPYDFDWTEETTITDDDIYSLYSQLPDDIKFCMIFDCCHSGGIHRDGGNKIRALNPPDDIRHRSLKWDRTSDMWVPRDFQRFNKDFSGNDDINKNFFGTNGFTSKLGRAVMLRGQTEKQYQAMKRKSGKKNFGPYLPLIIEACQESEYSYEYRHGVTSYGAFTYSLATILRQHKNISFANLVNKVSKQLSELQYDQKPQILGPNALVNARIPWSS